MIYVPWTNGKDPEKVLQTPSLALCLCVYFFTGLVYLYRKYFFLLPVPPCTQEKQGEVGFSSLYLLGYIRNKNRIGIKLVSELILPNRE